jgi:hypothetical protein
MLTWAMRSRLAALVLIAACGGGGGGGEPLISGSVSGDYEGNAFTATTGFAAASEDGFAIGIGDGGLDCDSPNDDEPPPGTNAVLFLPSLATGSYTNVFVNLYYNVDEFSGHGTGGGTVEITASSATSVAGTVSWSTTATGLTYSVNGTFEVVNCQ